MTAGAVHETTVWVEEARPEIPTGAAGTVAGVTDGDPCEGEPEPAALLATTLNEYALPLVRPVTEQLSAPDVEQV